MTSERTEHVEEVFREALEDDELAGPEEGPAITEGDVGVGQARRMGTDAGAAQAILLGTPQAAGVAPEREGSEPLPPHGRGLGVDVGVEGAAGGGAAPDAPATLDPTRTDADRNAAGGSWEGAAEVVESDYETEQLRSRQAEEHAGLPDPDEGSAEERLRT